MHGDNLTRRSVLRYSGKNQKSCPMKNQSLLVTVYLLKIISGIKIPKGETRNNFFTYEEIKSFPTDGAHVEICPVFQDTRGRTLSSRGVLYHQNEIFARNSVEDLRRKILERLSRDCFAGKMCSEDLSVFPSDDLKALLDTLPPVGIPEYLVSFFWIIPDEAEYIAMQSLEGMKTLGIFSLEDPYPEIRMHVVSKKLTQSFLMHFLIKYFGITGINFTKKMISIPTFTSN